MSRQGLLSRGAVPGYFTHLVGLGLSILALSALPNARAFAAPSQNVGEARPQRTPCLDVVLSAVLSDDLRTIQGQLRCLAAAELGTQVLFPNTLGPDQPLDDIQREWYYPDGFSPSGMEVSELRHANPEPATSPIKIHARSQSLRFQTRIPSRRGLLGRQGQIVHLLAGWHPALLAQDSQTLLARRYHYDITVPKHLDVVLPDMPQARPQGPGHKRYRGQFLGRYLPLSLAPAWTRWRHPKADVALWDASQKAKSLDAARRTLEPLGLMDQKAKDRRLLGALSRAISLLEEHTLPVPSLSILRVPIQEYLVQGIDGGVAISDRAFSLLPSQTLEAFHSAALWRVFLRAAVRPLAVRKETAHPELAADFVASALTDNLLRRHFGPRQSTQAILEDFAIIPEIDALIFAPQVPFKDAFYDAIDETPAHFVSPFDFFKPKQNALARGKRLYEKLCDRFGKDAVIAAALAYLRADTATLLEALQRRLFGFEPAAHWQPWLFAYPRLDYRLAEIHPGPPLRVEVAVSSDPSRPLAAIPQEPVTVAITTQDGKVLRQTRLGPGSLSFAEVDGEDDIRIIELDPDHRLVEHYRLPGKHAHHNNRIPQRWRFLLNNITGLFSITGGKITASADFSLRRLGDIRFHQNAYAQVGPDSFAALYALSYAFGEEITPLRLGHRVGAAAAYERLRPTDDALSAGAGHQGSVTLFYSHDTRLSPYWSYRGHGFNARVHGGIAQGDDGKKYQYAQAGAGALGVLPLGHGFGHALLGRVRGDLQWGNPPPQSALNLGGRYRGLRGFESGEVRGDLRLLASLEYRHVLGIGADFDILGAFTLTRFEGAFFADAAYLRQSRQDCSEDVFGDVGYGLRFSGDVANIAPASLQLDVALPLGRCRAESARAPMTIYLGFVQSFAAF